MDKEKNTCQDPDCNIKYIVPRFFIKSKTNNGEFAKQIFCVVSGEGYEDALLVRKLVLSDDSDLYRNFVLLREYKGKGLFEQTFNIKLSTLATVISLINLPENKEDLKDKLLDFYYYMESKYTPFILFQNTHPLILVGNYLASIEEYYNVQSNDDEPQVCEDYKHIHYKKSCGYKYCPICGEKL